MRKLAAILLKAQEAFGVALFVALTVVVTLQVVSRFIFHSPFLWSEEVARFLFFWVALTGAAISVRLRRHFIIDLVQAADVAEGGRRPRLLLRKTVRVVSDVAVLGFSVLLLVLGWEYTGMGSFRVGTNSGVNMAYVYAAIPFSAGTMAAYALLNLVETLRGGPPPHPDHRGEEGAV